MLTSITRNRKLVPHLLCSLELARTLSTVSGSPCSTQLMHLCSAPWYINVLWISFILEIRSIYPINNASFTNASTIVTANSEAPTLLQRLARAYGSNIKAATDTTIETATVTYNSHLNCLSSFAFFAASSSSERAAFFCLSSSSSSSPAISAEYIRHFVPTTRESTKLTTPRISGYLRNFAFPNTHL